MLPKYVEAGIADHHSVLGRNRKPFGGGFALEEEAVFLVSLEAEMGGGGNHAVERAEFFRDEAGDFAKVAAFDDDH